MSDEIGTIEIYRGVGIDDCQPLDRVETIVEPEIDKIFAMSSIDDLIRYCGDVSRPPEARRFAAAKVEASHDVSAAERVRRPHVDIDYVHALVAGLNSRRWRSPWGYGSLIDVPAGPGQSGHQPRPPEYHQQVEDDARRAAEEERVERLGRSAAQQ